MRRLRVRRLNFSDWAAFRRASVQEVTDEAPDRRAIGPRPLRAAPDHDDRALITAFRRGAAEEERGRITPEIVARTPSFQCASAVRGTLRRTRPPDGHGEVAAIDFSFSPRPGDDPIFGSSTSRRSVLGMPIGIIPPGTGIPPSRSRRTQVWPVIRGGMPPPPPTIRDLLCPLLRRRRHPELPCSVQIASDAEWGLARRGCRAGGRLAWTCNQPHTTGRIDSGNRIGFV